MDREKILSIASGCGVTVVAGSLDGTPDALVRFAHAMIESATIDDLRQSDAWIFYAAHDQREIAGAVTHG